MTTTDRSEYFAVVGAGPVGLAIAKALGEAKIPYEQLEADDDVGGNWYHGVYRTAHIISSRHTTEYGDFPMPDHYPDFPSRQQMVDYLRSYADKFNLRPQIQFNTKLVMAQPLPDQRWELALANGERRIYRGLIVCSGHHWDRRFPQYPGKFTGEYLHSKDYKHPDQLVNKRVLVIGGGNSACDIASEAARVGVACQLSLRRGYWFLPKTLFGVPLVEALPFWMPVFVQRLLLQVVLRIIVGRYQDYGLPQPDHRIFEHHPTINSELLHYLKHGRIQARPDVARYDGQRVHFVDGSSEEFDTVICATGFHVSFPFLPPGLVTINGSVARLYANCLLPEYKTLYIIGTEQPRYGFGPLVTLVARLLCRMIETQQKMELPLGLVLREMGEKLPQTHLVNPYQAMRRMKFVLRFFPFVQKMLLRREKALRSRFVNFAPVMPQETNRTNLETGMEPNSKTTFPLGDPDLRVY
jgi:Flavin-binding monooxygenase-like